MTPDKLKTLAEALWGFGWQSALAKERGYNIRTVQRWASGEWKIPDDLEAELIELIDHKMDDLGLLTSTGKYGTETKPMRIPVSLWQKVLEFIKQELSNKGK